MHMAFALAEVARTRSRGGGDGYLVYYLVRWLWGLIGWWSVLVGAAAVCIGGFLKRLAGGDDSS